jgi:hypothetical protein
VNEVGGREKNGEDNTWNERIRKKTRKRRKNEYYCILFYTLSFSNIFVVL